MTSLNRVVLLVLGLGLGPVILFTLFKPSPQASTTLPPGLTPGSTVESGSFVEGQKIDFEELKQRSNAPTAPLTVPPDYPKPRALDHPNPSTVYENQPVIPRTGAPPGATPFRR
jgi:hypothetical protein